MPIQKAKVAPGGSQGPLCASQRAIADLILAKNATYPYDATGSHPFTSKGGGLHKIDDATALGIAKVISDNADGGLTIPYMMACIAIESLFDPKCENGNYTYMGHTGSNPDKKPEGFDVGIAQLKLKYLMQDRKLSVEEADAFAKDYTKAIPYMTTTMKLLLGYADALIQDNKRTDQIPALLNRYCLATLAYNLGRTGLKRYLATATAISTHGSVVMAYENEYSKKLNLPSVF